MEILNEIEAAEDEILLEELDWSKVGNDPKEIQVALAVQSETLNTEIIDFLLQWEEDENVNKALPDSKRVRDTFEVLNALSQVDNELECVDVWISDQIERLSQIQSRLSVIEHESGTLESSYQNLTSIQEMVESLVVGLSISREDEEILLHHPHEVIDAALKLRNLDHTGEIIQPLIDAVTNIKEALVMKGGKLTQGISTAQWKQLQAMTAISKQKQKLVEMKDYFTKKFSKTLAGLFESVLKHKSLHKEVKNTFTGVEIKQFSFTIIIDHGLKFSAKLLNAAEHDKGYSEGSESAEPALCLRHSSQQNDSNAGLSAVRNYHRALEGFLPLYALVFDLSPTYVPMVSQAYVTSTLERLYIPLFRILFREIRSLIMPKSAMVTYANISKSRHSQGLDFDIPLKFLPRNSTKGEIEFPLTQWAAVGAVILAIAPILKEEENFFLALFSHLDASSLGIVQTQEGEVGGEKVKGEVEKALDLMFSTITSKLTKLCNLIVAEIDGMEILGILAVLQQYVTDHLLSKQQMLQTQQQEQEQLLQPQHTGILTTTTATTTAAAATSTSTTAIQAQNTKAETVKPDHSSLYLITMLHELRFSLLSKLKSYIGDQVAWILAQKSDPKKAGVTVPVAKFPSFVRQVLEMTGGQRIDFVDQLLYRVAKDLFSWINSVAALNEKYSDIVKVQNFGFFALSIGPLKQGSLEKFVSYAAQQKRESESKYVLWMVSYAFPALSVLAARMDGVGNRVREEELALYVRRKDVVSVVKELDSKSLSDPIGKMYKRLEKHFASSSDDQELDLVSICWIKIRDRVTSILTKLEEAASASYQISLTVGPLAVKEMFNKFRKHK